MTTIRAQSGGKFLLATTILIGALIQPHTHAAAEPDQHKCTREISHDSLWDEAGKLFNSGNYEEAEQCLIVAAEVAPTTHLKAKALFFAAWTENHINNESIVIDEFFDKIVEVDSAYTPDSNRTSYKFRKRFTDRKNDRGLNYLKRAKESAVRGDIDNAITMWKRAAQLGEKRATLELARWYKANSRPDEAIPLYDQLVNPTADSQSEIYPEEYIRNMRFDLSMCHLEKHDYGSVRDELIKVLKIEEGGLAWSYLAYANSKLGIDFSEAVRKAETLSPRDSIVMFNLGRAYSYGNQLEVAAERLTIATELDDQNREAFLELGRVRSRLNQAHRAIDAYEAAERLSTSPIPWLWRQLSRLHYDVKNYPLAESYAKKVIQLDSKDHLALFLLGQAQIAQDKYYNARSSLNAANELEPKEQAYIMELMNVLQNLQDCAAIINEVKLKVADVPDCTDCRKRFDDLLSWCAGLHPEP